MAESAQIQKLSVKHEAIMDYLLANPTTSLGDLAAYFGITQTWLSVIIHSPAFQDRLAEKKDTLFHHSVVATVRDKLSVIAHKALDRMADQLDFESSHKEIRETADMALERLGIGGKANVPPAGIPGTVNNNTLIVARSIYAEAQERIGSRPFEIQGFAEAATVLVDEAPPVQRAQIEETLRAGGIPVSEPLHGDDGGEA